MPLYLLSIFYEKELFPLTFWREVCEGGTSGKSSGGLSRQVLQVSRNVVPWSMIQTHLTPLQSCNHGKVVY